jgi:hypothetical protein
MKSTQSTNDIGEFENGPHFTEATEPEPLRGWEEVDVGRFMPRRIRGSYRGRALG